MFLARQIRHWWIYLVALLGAAFGLIILFDLWPWLRGNETWHWWEAPAVPAGRLALYIAALVAFVIGWWLLGLWLAKNPPHAWLALSGLFFLTMLVQTTMLALFRQNPVALQYEYLVSNQVSGYFTASQELGHLPTALREYPQRMPAFTADPHPRSKPPGIVLLYWGWEQLLARLPALSEPIGRWARSIRCADFWVVYRSDAALAANTIMGILTPFISTLSVWPAFSLARRRWGVKAGWLAAGLTALIPGRLLFTPNMDTVYPLFTLLGLYFVDSGLHKKRWALTAAGGFFLSANTFFSLVNGFAGLLAGLFLIFRIISSAPDRKSAFSELSKGFAWQQMAAFAGGCLSIWLFYGLAFDVWPLAIYEAAGGARNDLSRSYWLWLGWNLVDFTIFTGLPMMLLAIDSINLRKSVGWPALTLAFWIILLGLDISGQIRAEVGRIWLMLSPIPVLIAAGHIWRRAKDDAGPKLSLAFIGVMALISGSLGLRWEVNPLEWPPPEQHDVSQTRPPVDHPLDVVFDPAVHLIGYDLTAAEQLEITLYWETTGRPRTPYTVFIHLLNEAGDLAAQSDSMPQANRLPMTCWLPGEYITDSHTLSLAGLPPGSYTLRLGLYDLTTLEQPAPPIELETLQL